MKPFVLPPSQSRTLGEIFEDEIIPKANGIYELMIIEMLNKKNMCYVRDKIHFSRGSVDWSRMALIRPRARCDIIHDTIEEAGTCARCWWAGQLSRNIYNDGVGYGDQNRDGQSWSWRVCLPEGHKFNMN